MRYLLLLVSAWLLALPTAATSLPRDTAVLRIAHLPADGLVLNHGWRYRAGDNPVWAQPDFDDSRWDTLTPTRPRRELPAAVGRGISWLRLRFQLSDSLQGHALAVSSYQLGACEVYLNGRLVLRQGQLNADPTRVISRGRFPAPGEVPAGGPSVQVLAVRYAPWQPPMLGGISHQAQLLLQLFTTQQFREDEVRQRAGATVFLVAMGVFALLSLLHVAFFRYNPAQRANLYFAFFALAATLACACNYCESAWVFATQVPYLVVSWWLNALFALSSLWLVRALYALFHLRPGRLYAGLWAGYGLLLLAQGFAPYHPATDTAQNAFLILAGAEQLRLTGRALRLRQRGAWIIGSGFAGGLLAVVGLIPQNSWNILVVENLLTNLSMALVFVLPALGISLFLAREFALDAILLQVKLGEVERLSAQTLAQEQDKQALLAAQNDTLEAQVTQRTGELQRSLTELRTTQTQLIQKEKMASLGELTAGIAHEIQNPLNFVNNFSDVSAELVAELREERAKGTAADVGLEEELLEDLTQNLGKIGHHGRRAAGIVKGMLEHSQFSAGEREPTDLNRLCDQYLRLAYQGLRAKDKSFNAALTTNFQPDLPPVEVVGTEVGRVLLNLFINAFYAVRQRQQAGEPSYQPQVGVRTVLLNQEVHIHVTDNGTGMSPAIQNKIFQPFFTTKPTGEGTGLGLSLSHDIIAQGHGGTLRVESQEGKGTTFSVILPLNSTASHSSP